MEATRIIEKALDFIKRNSDTDGLRWYVGITADYEQRLKAHNVSDDDCYRVYRADDEDEARIAEKVLLAELGKNGKGAPGGGTNPVWVYVYKITWKTDEES